MEKEAEAPIIGRGDDKGFIKPGHWSKDPYILAYESSPSVNQSGRSEELTD